MIAFLAVASLLVLLAVAPWRRTSLLAEAAGACRILGLEPDPAHPMRSRGRVAGRGLVLRYGWAKVEIRTEVGSVGLAFGASAFRTGDARFDAAVGLVADDPVAALGLLDGPTRDRLAELAAFGATCDGEVFTWVVHEGDDVDRRTIAGRARALAHAHAALLARQGSLAERICDDRSPGVRLRAVEVARQAGLLLEVAAAVRRADPATRLAAAVAGDDWDAAREMMATERPLWRVRAAAALADREPERALPVLMAALGDPDLVDDAAPALARVGHTDALLALRQAGHPAASAAAELLAERLRAQAGSLSLASREGELALAEEPR